MAKPKKLIGWREWVALPGLDVARVKAKVDTGARSSALHAFDLRVIEGDGPTRVRFSVHPLQRSAKGERLVEYDLHEMRWVRSSTGHRTRRPVIITEVELAGLRWPIEVTLVGRDTMGFRMLLGRSAVRGRFMIDPGRSFLAGAEEPVAKRRRRARPPEAPEPKRKRRRKDES